jgi:hypothetical protein
VSTAATTAEAPDPYGVTVRSEPDGWRVSIVDLDEREIWSRACRTESEARTFASTVRQHLRWLSESKFREYYGIPEARAATGDEGV